MFSELAIRVNNLSKRYEIYGTPRDRLKQFILPHLQFGNEGKKEKYFKEFWALQDVSFDVRKGETIGIVGRNGAGKSTLLQMICGTLTPSSGQVVVHGRVAALLELGSGFNPDFTGRENVYMNAAVLGFTKEETEAKFDQIAAFADINHFIDQPVKTYSSGMIARLAFAVAVQVEPDVLVIDEALSVGDMAFQEKSFTKMKQIRDRGTSILFVSHSPSAVRNFCDRAIWIDAGKMRAIGERLEVCDQYEQAMEEKMLLEIGASDEKAKGTISLESRRPRVTGTTIGILNVISSRDSYRMGSDIEITISLKFSEQVPVYGIGLIISDIKGNVIAIINTLRDDIFLDSAKESVTLIIKNNHFSPGKYNVTVSISDAHGMFSFDKWDSCLSFIIEMERSSRGLAKVDGFLRCDHEWS